MIRPETTISLTELEAEELYKFLSKLSYEELNPHTNLVVFGIRADLRDFLKTPVRRINLDSD